MKVKVPFEPSSIAQSAALSALDDKDFISRSINLNEEGSKYLRDEFQKLGIKYIASSANFLTTIWETQEQANLITNKLLNYGVIVRNLGSFGWPEYIRISIGLEEENQRFIHVMNKIL